MLKYILQRIGKARSDYDATKGHVITANGDDIAPACKAAVNPKKWHVSDEPPDFMCKNCERGQ